MIFAVIFFFASSIIFTFPLILKMNYVPTGFGAGDAYLYLWNAYIFWKELLSAQNPFFTEMVLFPVGVNLAFHDYSPLTNLILGLFGNNLVFGMNLLILLAFTLNGTATFFLLRYATGNYFLSIFGGLLYSFSPVMFSFLLTEHYYYLIAAVFLPLGMCFLLRFLKQPKIKYFLLLIIIFWIIFLISYYTAILYALLLGISFLTRVLISIFKKDNISNLGINRLFLLGILFVILPLSVSLVFLFKIEDFQKYKVSESTISQYCSADLSGYIIPNIAVPHMQKISLVMSDKFNVRLNGDTPSYFLGLTYIFLSIAAFYKFKKKKEIFSISMAGFLVLLLSLGDTIKIGKLFVLDERFTVFYWFSKMPPFGFIGCPVRFSIGVLLVVILLSFLLINDILKTYKLSVLLNCLFLLALFLIEFGIPKIKFLPTTIPEIYQEISTKKDGLTVLEVPSGLTEGYGYFGFDYSIPELNGLQMYWQTYHKKPRIGGYISRIPQTTYEFFMEEPVISDIFRMTNYKSKEFEKSYSKIEMMKFINKFNIGYIVFSPNQKQNEYLRKMETLLKGFTYQKTTKGEYILITLERG